MPSTAPSAKLPADPLTQASSGPTKALQDLSPPDLFVEPAPRLSFRSAREFLTASTITDETRRRSMMRYRRAALTGVTSIFAKVIVLITTIVSVPLTFRYLGIERYGLWMTITSFVLFLGFADLGVGNGLVAGIAEAYGKDDVDLARRQVSCAFFLLLALAATICLVFACAFPFLPWAAFYGTHTSLASHEAGPATAILVVCTALSMPFGTVLRVQLGYQRGYLGDLWNAAGNALALAGIVLATHLGGSLPVLVLAVAAAPLFATTVNWLVEFFRVQPWLRPRAALFDTRTALRIASLGSLFFLQQCFGLIYYVSDNIVIARTMGAAAVAQYAVLQRVFSIGLVAQYFMVPLWPAIGEALGRRDYTWARMVIRRAITLSLALGLFCGIALLAASRWLMKRWSGIDLGPIDTLRIGFAVWVVLVGYVASMNAILNQPGVMRRHLVLFGAASLASLALKIAFARHGSIAGVIWATTLAFGILYVVPAALLAFRSVVPPHPEEAAA